MVRLPRLPGERLRKRVTSTLNPNAEHQEQVRLFEWARLQWALVPELRMLFAVPNGFHAPKHVRQWMVDEGMQAGMLDVVLAVPRLPFHGLYLENKAVTIRVNLTTGARTEDPGTVSAEQEGWMRALIEQGYAVDAQWSWEHSRDTILTYLRGGFVQRPVEELVRYPGRNR